MDLREYFDWSSDICNPGFTGVRTHFISLLLLIESDRISWNYAVLSQGMPITKKCFEPVPTDHFWTSNNVHVTTWLRLHIDTLNSVLEVVKERKNILTNKKNIHCLAFVIISAQISLLMYRAREPVPPTWRSGLPYTQALSIDLFKLSIFFLYS